MRSIKIFICITIVTFIYLVILGDKVQSPKTNSQFDGMQYTEAISLLEDAGFKNITTDVKDDLILGLFTKDGEVTRVAIGGSIDYSNKTKFDKNVDVVVTYHTFPNKDNKLKTTDNTQDRSDKDIKVESNDIKEVEEKPDNKIYNVDLHDIANYEGKRVEVRCCLKARSDTEYLLEHPLGSIYHVVIVEDSDIKQVDNTEKLDTIFNYRDSSGKTTSGKRTIITSSRFCTVQGTVVKEKYKLGYNYKIKDAIIMLDSIAYEYSVDGDELFKELQDALNEIKSGKKNKLSETALGKYDGTWVKVKAKVFDVGSRNADFVNHVRISEYTHKDMSTHGDVGSKHKGYWISIEDTEAISNKLRPNIGDTIEVVAYTSIKDNIYDIYGDLITFYYDSGNY